MRKRKYKLNENIFDDITNESAWVLGFIYSDGNIRCAEDKRGGKNYGVGFHQSKLDYDALCKIRNILNSDAPIKLYNDGYISLNFNSKTLVCKLIDMGCMPAKSLILTYPDYLNNKTQQHFIRGLFDGDGSFSYTNHDKKITIVGTKSVCEGIKKVTDHIGIISRIYVQGKVFVYTIRRWASIYKFFKYIYEDTDDGIRLNRKYEHFKQAEHKMLEFTYRFPNKIN